MAFKKTARTTRAAHSGTRMFTARLYAFAFLVALNPCVLAVQRQVTMCIAATTSRTRGQEALQSSLVVVALELLVATTTTAFLLDWNRAKRTTTIVARPTT